MKKIASAGGNRNKLVVALDTFQDINTLDIRKYYFDKKTEEFCPTRKGITLTKDTYSTVRNVLSDFDEEITDWLVPDDTSSEVRKDAQGHASSAENARYQVRKHERGTNERKSPVFFESESKGAVDTILYNNKHEFVKHITVLLDQLEDSGADQSLCEELRNVIDILLLSFCRARNLYDNSPVISPDILFDDLLFNWGQMLQNYASE